MTLMRLRVRLTNRTRRVLELIGFNSKVRQIEIYENSSPTSRNLLIIGSGQVTVPPTGWGAVETIIAETIPVFQNNDYRVKLVNSRAIPDFIRALKFKPDLILVHDDISTKRVRLIFKSTPIIAVTHYGLAAYPEMWHRSYKKAIRSLRSANYIICLNENIKSSLSKFVDVEKLIVCANGTSFTSDHTNGTGQGLICLGKVEPRKRQYELFLELRNSDINISFVGEIADERVAALLRGDPDLRKYFLGPWDRLEIALRMKNYDALILLSSGEADALVLYEAQISGLPILVSEGALGSQDQSIDWIKVLPNAPTEKDITAALKSVKSSHKEISEWAHANYTWENQIQRLLTLMKEIVSS